MSRIALIHGFATGIHFSFLRPAYGSDAGFTAFQIEVKRGEAKVFRWDIKERASFFQSLNPFYIWNVYRRERSIVKKTTTHAALQHFLESESPEILVCHSMGVFLFFEYLRHGELPASVRRVVFSQADLSSKQVRFSPLMEERIRSGELQITNAYCPWDPTLWFSRVLNGQRAGLTGMRHPLVHERFFPLIKPVNLHTSAIRSSRFRSFVEHVQLAKHP